MTDWESIVTQYGPKVWRTAYRVLSDHADALDCYQETFLSACRSPPRAAVIDWGRVPDDPRRPAGHRPAPGSRAGEVPHGRARTLPDPAGSRPRPGRSRRRRRSSMARVRAALAGLPDRQAEVLWLSCVEGMPHDRIAAELRTTPGAVRLLLHRARAGLAATLNPATTGRTEP